MKESKLLDSSVWIELFDKRRLHQKCDREFKSAKRIVVPTIVIFEVYRKLAKTYEPHDALAAIGPMSRYEVVDLNRKISLEAADLSIEHGLATADSLVLAHAKNSNSTLITLDHDFINIPEVRVIH